MTSRSLTSPVPSHFNRALSPTLSYFDGSSGSGSGSGSGSKSSSVAYINSNLSYNSNPGRHSDNYRDVPMSDSQMRQSCLESIYKVHQKYQLSPDCLHAAISLLYRHIGSTVADRAPVSKSPAQISSLSSYPFTRQYNSTHMLPPSPYSTSHGQTDDRFNQLHLTSLVCLTVACQLTQTDTSSVTFGIDQCVAECRYMYSHELIRDLQHSMTRHWMTGEATLLPSSTGYAHLSQFLEYLHVCEDTAKLSMYYLEQCLFHQSLMIEASSEQIAVGCLFAALCHHQQQQRQINEQMRAVYSTSSTSQFTLDINANEPLMNNSSSNLEKQQRQELLRVSGLSSQTVSALVSEILQFISLNRRIDI